MEIGATKAVQDRLKTTKIAEAVEQSAIGESGIKEYIG